MPVREHNHRKPLVRLGFVALTALANREFRDWRGNLEFRPRSWRRRRVEFGILCRVAAAKSHISAWRFLRGWLGATTGRSGYPAATRSP